MWKRTTTVFDMCILIFDISSNFFTATLYVYILFAVLLLFYCNISNIFASHCFVRFKWKKNCGCFHHLLKLLGFKTIYCEVRGNQCLMLWLTGRADRCAKHHTNKWYYIVIGKTCIRKQTKISNKIQMIDSWRWWKFYRIFVCFLF